MPGIGPKIDPGTRIYNDIGAKIDPGIKIDPGTKIKLVPKSTLSWLWRLLGKMLEEEL